MYRAITLFCAAALVACAPAKLYRYGETAASPSAIGVLKGPHYIQIVSIDGVTEMERPGCTGPACTEGFEIYFSPGVHRLTVKFGDSVSKEDL